MQEESQNKPLTILVTGGAGYIGSHMTWALLKEKTETKKRKYNVIVLDNFSLGYTYPISRTLAPKLIKKKFTETQGKKIFNFF